MSKDMYDENGILKPEFVMTESERKAMLFNIGLPNTDELDFNKVKKILDEKIKTIEENIIKNKISFKTFEEYYILLKIGISSGLLDKPLSFALSLSFAFVMPIDTDERESKYEEYIEDLKDIIAKEIRKSLDNSGINLAQELLNRQKNASLYTITFTQYCDFCSALDLAIMAKLDNVDYMECIRTLQNAKIEPTKSYEEHIKLHKYQRRLLDMATQIEQQTRYKQK